jgi:hypothetical protein
MDPRVALTNAGIDTNVYNEPDEQDPESDFTATLTPSADLWLPMGSTWVFGTVREDLVWFKEFASERSINSRLRVGWLVPLTRVAFDVSAGWTDTRERVGSATWPDPPMCWPSRGRASACAVNGGATSSTRARPSTASTFIRS